MRCAQNLPALITLSMLVAACSDPVTDNEPNRSSIAAEPTQSVTEGKPVVYQVFTRLFGNRETANVPWGTIEQNGVGKFSDFDDRALEGIRELGVSHIWYTGVPHHAVIRDYTNYGIDNDDPDVVKGRAGSPYAVKDYYNVNPDLADDPARRLEEFEALIERTHAHGMKVIIDIVPNHVARNYQSASAPAGTVDFGVDDDSTVEYARDNNFYYVVGEDFAVPESPPGYAPLGGDPHPLADGRFNESPARWTGNGARTAQPGFDDWFETIKVNYGVRPDGSYDFDRLPEGAANWTTAQHAEFWSGRDVPDSWTKFRDIVSYWTTKGVDGFRYDMAEMVPVEFWSYLNSGIRELNDDAFLLAEVYNPALYRDYLKLGRMDYLYDKVGFYDTLRGIMRGERPASDLAVVHGEVLDIEVHMLHFLENHDEQRIASRDFAGDARFGMPAMTVSALISRSPTMLYFGQDVGERGDGDPGFGAETRTTIFDYWGVPAHQRWMNDGRFDGGALSEDEQALRDFYVQLMNLSATSPAMQGGYAPVDILNLNGDDYNERVFAFARWFGRDRLIVAANFDGADSQSVDIKIPERIVQELLLVDGRYTLDARLGRDRAARLVVEGGVGTVRLELKPFESVALYVGAADIIRHLNMSSAHVAPRNIDVWLPDGYRESNQRYRVLYMHDGQNLFNEEITWNRQSWGVDVALADMQRDGLADDTIIVGIWNTKLRYREYMPQVLYDALAPEDQVAISEFRQGAPLSDDYLRFIVEELKPFIDQAYRTRDGRADTLMMGSSMGGLISLYAALRYPDVFSQVACVSTHWPLGLDEKTAVSGESIVASIRDVLPAPGRQRFYFDYGTEGLDAAYESRQLVIDKMFVALGYTRGEDFVSLKFDGEGHSEDAWRRRVREPLGFLLGQRAPAD